MMKKDKRVKDDGMEVPQYPGVNFSYGIDSVEGDTPVKDISPHTMKDRKVRLLSRKMHIMVEMKHHNGSVRHFLVKPKGNQFQYLGNLYVIDEDAREYDISSGCFMLRYHEGCALPYRLDIKKTDLGTAEAEVSIDPSLLADVVKGKYLQVLLRSAELDAYFRKAFILIIICLAVSLAHFVAVAYKGGWF